MEEKPKPKPRTRRYEKSSNYVEINDDTRAALACNTSGLQVPPGVDDILEEVKNLKQQLSNVKEERDEFKEEVTFLKYQLAYRAQVQNLQKEMSERNKPKNHGAKKSKSVRFSANIDVNSRAASDGNDSDESFEDTKDGISESSFDSSFDSEEFTRLKIETDEIRDVLYDFYHDAKMAGKNANILIGDIESHPSESMSALVCRVLVNYDKLCEENRILEEEKTKLDEDKLQLCNSLAKLREQLHDAVDSNIEEIEELNRENEELRSEVETFGGKNSEVVSALVEARQEFVNRLKTITELSNVPDKLVQLLKNDSLQAANELRKAKELVKNTEVDKNKLKRVKSLPPSLRQESLEISERGGLLRELKTCKNLQESQRQQISKILDEKLSLETQVAELKRQIVLLKAERRVSVKTKSKLIQTELKELQLNGENSSSGKNGANVSEETQAELKSLSKRCKDLENKLEQVKREKSTAEREKTSLLLSLDANIEKKDALEEQLAVLHEKIEESNENPPKKLEMKLAATQSDGLVDEADGEFQKSYKGISDAKIEIEKIRVQEQEKQIAILKRENEAVKEKLKKAEDMSRTLQNCLKELTDEKHELLDSIEELNEEKAELEEARLKLEKKYGGTIREKFVADEVSDIRNKERKVGDNLEENKAKLTQLNLKVIEVLALIDSEGTRNKKSDVDNGVEDMIGFLLSSVENLKLTVTAFKTSYEKTQGENLRTQNELEALNVEKTELDKEIIELQSMVEKLTKQNREMVDSLERSSKSFENKMEKYKKENARLEKELGQLRGAKSGYEKTSAQSARREEDLGRQLKNLSAKRDDLQQAFDQLTKQSTEASARSTKELEALRRKNKKLTSELEQLREDLEGTTEDRDELLELLDRIVCENGSADEKQGLGQKVERIRERSKSEENLIDVGAKDIESAKHLEEKKLVVGRKPPGDETVEGRKPVVEENLVVSREANMEYVAAGENELFEENGKSERNGPKERDELQKENQRLKEMIEKMLNDQKKMEVVLNSLSEANAEIHQGLEESLEHTEQIRQQGSESKSLQDVVNFAPKYRASSDENAELRRLHEAMVGTNEALSANLRRLHDEKTRSEQLKNSFQDVTQRNAALEENVENMTKNKEKTENEVLDLKKKLKDGEREILRAKNEKLDLESLLDENNGRLKDLKFQIDSLTEINQDLRETNDKLSSASKESEKKLSKVTDKFDELGCRNDELKKAKKQLEKELTEQRKQKSRLELELSQSKDTIASLRKDVTSCGQQISELQKSLETSEEELKSVQKSAGEAAKQEQEAQATLKTKMEEVRKSLAERDQRVAELENDVIRLRKEIQNSQRFVKAVSQENDTLRDSLSEWEREVGKIRQHVHQLSQDAAENSNNNNGEIRDRKSQELDKVRSVKAFEAMQVEMEAINKHLKSLANENKELNTKLDAITKENSEVKNRNIELLTQYDMVSKDLEKKMSEITKLANDAKTGESKTKKNSELREEYEKERNSLHSRIAELNLENTLLKNGLANTLDEENEIAETLEGIIHSHIGKKVKSKSGRKTGSKRHTQISGSTTKPDLIRDSTKVKDELSIVEQRNYRSKLTAIEGSGAEPDIQELLGNLLKGQANMKSYCHEISQAVKDKSLQDKTKASDQTDSGLEKTKTELNKTSEAKKQLELSLAKKEEELTKVQDEKAKVQSESAAIKEKCDKLQAVFRALILVMNDNKKSGDKKGGEEAEGPTRIIDYIKGIKTKFTALNSEKENLEAKIVDLQSEIEEHKARAKTKVAESGRKQKTPEANAEDKERILNKLLLSSAREKRHLLEKLGELFDEFSKVKSNLEEELENKSTKGTKLQKINEEFTESITRTERFIQSVAHDRPVTVVADSASEKDPSLELAKENEELLGRISAIQSSRRRESKNFKNELTKVEKDKMEAVNAEQAKWKDEMEKARAEQEKKLKENEEAATEVRNALKQEVSQLKLDIRRLSDEHELAQRAARNEACLDAKKMEEKMNLLRSEMDKKVAENESKVVEIKRKADVDLKERARMAEAEISAVRANWAEAERKLRAATEVKVEAIRELERAQAQRGEEGSKSARELQKVKVALESAQTQASEREDVFKRERDRLQKTISNLEASVRSSENSGHDLVTDIEKLRFENDKLRRELWDQNQPRRIGGIGDRHPNPNAPYKDSSVPYNDPYVPYREPNVPQRDRNVPYKDPTVPYKDPTVPYRDPNVPHKDPNVPYKDPSVPYRDPNVPYKDPNVPYKDPFVPYRDPNVHYKDPNMPYKDPNIPYKTTSLPYTDPNPPSGERVKVTGTVRQSPVERRKVIPVESSPGGPTFGVAGPIHGDAQRRVKVRQGQATNVYATRVQEQGARRGNDRDMVTDELGAMFRELSNSPEWMDESHSTVVHARPMQTGTVTVPSQKPQPEWEIRPDRTWPMLKNHARHSASYTRHKDPPPSQTPAQPSSQVIGYHKEDTRQRPPGYPNSKPIARQVQGNLETAVVTSSPDPRRAHEVTKPPIKSYSIKNHRPRGTSVGSDDVFERNTADVATTLTSHGSKTGEFWRSRSLENLTIPTEDRPIKHSEHSTTRGHKQKLPKSYSGPRKGERRQIGVAQGKGTAVESGAKRVTPLKGMEYVLFQSQI